MPETTTFEDQINASFAASPAKVTTENPEQTQVQPSQEKTEIKTETTAAPVETTAPANTEQPEIKTDAAQSDLFDRLKEIFPNATRESILEEISKIREEREVLAQEKSLKAEVEPEIVRQNEFAKATGIKSTAIYEAVFGDVSKLSDLDIVMLGEKMKNPSMSDNLRAALENEYKTKYHLAGDEDEEISPEQKELAAYRLKQEADSVRANINKIVSTVNAAVPSEENIRERLTLNSGKWDDSVTTYFAAPEQRKVTQSVSLDGLKDFISDGGTLQIEYNIPETEYVKELSAFISEAKRNGMEFNENNQQVIAGLVRQKLINKSIPEIVGQAVKQSVEKAHASWISKTTNTTKTTEQAPVTTTSAGFKPTGDVSTDVYNMLLQ